MLKPKPSNRKKLIKDSSQFLAATIFAQGIGMMRGILMPLLFSPAQLGIWNLMGVIIGYGGNATVGLVHGMNKAIPLLRGQGNEEECEKIRCSVFWMVPLVSILVVVILWCSTLWVPTEFKQSLKITALIIFLQQFFVYIYSLLRADGRFDVVSQGIGIQSFFSVGLIILLALTLPDRLIGALFGLICGYLIVLSFWFLKGRYRFPFKVEFRSIRKAFGLGFPIFIIGILDSVFISVDRWLIVSYLDEVSVGYYALGIMIGNLLGLVPGSIASVLYPNMLESFGAGKDITAGRDLLMGPFMILSAFMLVLVAALIFGVPLLIQLFLTKYIPSIPIVQILAPGIFFWALSNLPSTYLISIDKQNWIVGFQVLVGLFIIAFGSLVLWMGKGIIGMALLTSCGYAIYGLCLIGFAFRLMIKRNADLFRFLFRFLLPFAVMIVSAFAANWLISQQFGTVELILMTGKRLLLVMSCLITSLWFVNRKSEAFLIGLSELKAWYQAQRFGE